MLRAYLWTWSYATLLFLCIFDKIVWISFVLNYFILSFGYFFFILGSREGSLLSFQTYLFMLSLDFILSAILKAGTVADKCAHFIKPPGFFQLSCLAVSWLSPVPG